MTYLNGLFRSRPCRWVRQRHGLVPTSRMSFFLANGLLGQTAHAFDACSYGLLGQTSPQVMESSADATSKAGPQASLCIDMEARSPVIVEGTRIEPVARFQGDAEVEPHVTEALLVKLGTRSAIALPFSEGRLALCHVFDDPLRQHGQRHVPGMGTDFPVVEPARGMQRSWPHYEPTLRFEVDSLAKTSARQAETVGQREVVMPSSTSCENHRRNRQGAILSLQVEEHIVTAVAWIDVDDGYAGGPARDNSYVRRPWRPRASPKATRMAFVAHIGPEVTFDSSRVGGALVLPAFPNRMFSDACAVLPVARTPTLTEGHVQRNHAEA